MSLRFGEGRHAPSFSEASYFGSTPSVLAAGEPRAEAGPRARLSPRETQVLALLAQGCSNREMACRMTVSEDTIKYHLKNIYGKLGVRHRTKALLAALDAGLLGRAGKL